jgi:type II secretory pathway pseudopilin PulG
MLEPRRKTELTAPWRTRKFKRSLLETSLQSGESGFTILEALMALMVAAILMVAIGPMVTLSVAARVQGRRVDLATQAARSYIDGLRSGANPPPGNNEAEFSAGNLGVPAPVRLPGSPDLAANEGITCLDKNLNTLSRCGNPNNPPFLAIQAFRGRESSTTAAITDPDQKNQAIQKEGYCLGVRVYRADAFENGSAPTETKPNPAPWTSSLSSKKYPLVVMQTQIINQTSFEDYQKRYAPSDPSDPGSPRQGNPCNPNNSSW